ncbi:MAG: ATP-binding protein [Thermodesulfobacteriota bacterium]
MNPYPERLGRKDDEPGLLRRLAAHQALAEARERRRIAEAIQDQVIQQLCALKLLADQWRRRNPGDSPRIADITSLADRIITSAGLLVEEISPCVLHLVGLEAGLESLLDKVQEEYGLQVEFEDDLQPKPLGDDLKNLVFAAVQELVRNAVKHGRAGRIRISVANRDGLLDLWIEDDGQGFDPELVWSSYDLGRAFGLMGVRERISAVGGRLEVSSRSGQGTRVSLQVPLADKFMS